MPLDIDGAGRSRSLACLPTARGTVAPTTGQVVVPSYHPQLLYERISGPGALRPRKGGSAARNFSPHSKPAQAGFKGPPRGFQEPLDPPSRGLRGPPGTSTPGFAGASRKVLRVSRTLRSFQKRGLQGAGFPACFFRNSAYTNEKNVVVDQDGPN